MRAEPRVLVTRPAGQADALIDGLKARGLGVLHLPMLRLQALDPLPAAARRRVTDLERYDHLIFISANAAQFGVARIDESWPQRPGGQQCWAVGESTAKVLEQAGFTVRRPQRDMSSEGLLAMPDLADVRGKRVLIVKGEGGRDTLREVLSERGAGVDTMACYRRTPPDLSAEACQAALRRQPVELILISSGEGLVNLSRLLQPRENTNLAGITMIVPSARVAAAADDLGWRRVRCAANAADASMLAAVDAWTRDAEARNSPGEQRW